MRAFHRLAWHFAAAALIPLSALSDVLNTGVDYEPKANDTYVQGDTGTCCVGEYYSLTIAYIGQSFVATGRVPYSLTLSLVNNQPGDVPPANPQFRLLITELGDGGFQPGKILWEAGPFAVAARLYTEYTYEIKGVQLEPGKRYAWILDTYSERDGAQDAMSFLTNNGYNVPTYTFGEAWFQSATGQGSAADFAYPWTYYGHDISFLIRYKGNGVSAPPNGR